MEPKRRAVISTTDKTGIIQFALALVALGWEIISTSGTSKTLREGNVPVTEVRTVTGFEEMMEGLVRTLHPNIHAGILVLRARKDFMAEIRKAGIGLIDIVVVNLYRFAETVARQGCTIGEAMWNLDIGGPCLLRSAAKNHFDVTVVVDPNDYSEVLRQMQTSGNTTAEYRQRLAAKAFSHTAYYDSMVAHYLNGQCGIKFPDQLTIGLQRVGDTLRYGENPHQKGAVYGFPQQVSGTVATAKHLSGNPPSYNNYQDADAGWQLVTEFTRPAAAVIKHANPCGCAEAETLFEAMQRAWEADPISRFGGIVVCNRIIDVPTAAVFLAAKNKVDVIVAPGYDPDVLGLIKDRKGWGKTVCVLTVEGERQSPHQALAFRQIDGGMLVQEEDGPDPWHKWRKGSNVGLVSKKVPKDSDVEDLYFAWIVVKHVKSNAIVICKNQSLIGMGAGQPNRVTSVELALKQAGEKAKGAVLASDAFFPFPDGPELASKAGITAIIQPGGSVKDQEVIDAMNQAGVAMVFTGIRHFKH